MQRCEVELSSGVFGCDNLELAQVLDAARCRRIRVIEGNRGSVDQAEATIGDGFCVERDGDRDGIDEYPVRSVNINERGIATREAGIIVNVTDRTCRSDVRACVFREHQLMPRANTHSSRRG